MVSRGGGIVAAPGWLEACQRGSNGVPQVGDDASRLGA